MNKYYSCLLAILIPAITLMQVKSAVAVTTQENEFWRETTAQITVNNSSIEELEFENTLLGLLVKENGKQPKDLLESDQKNMLSFSIEYNALIKKAGAIRKKRITQHGLYRTLHPQLQQSFINNTSPTSIMIRYALENPVAIKFIMNQEEIDAPALLTGTIDDHWEPTEEPVLLPGGASD